jgi:hypothetical protein
VKTFPRLDILPDAQRKLWPELAPARQCGFVLYGGTAVALRLGHRESLDFDFFTDRDFQPSDLEQRLPLLRAATVLQQGPNTLTVLVPCGSGQVKVSLFGGLPFGRIEAPCVTPDGVMEVAALRDLLGHKLKVMLQRVEAKDYLDIDAILASGHDLAAGLAAAQALFRNFPAQDALKALSYYEGGDLPRLPKGVCERLSRAAGAVRTIPPAPAISPHLSATQPPCDLPGRPAGPGP